VSYPSAHDFGGLLRPSDTGEGVRDFCAGCRAHVDACLCVPEDTVHGVCELCGMDFSEPDPCTHPECPQ
jgi:hypothetical protein